MDAAFTDLYVQHREVAVQWEMHAESIRMI